METKKKYSIGLDIGTASVGWACVTEDFEILSYRSKPAYGVHIFDSANTAEARRLQRGMRRRYNRRVKRIQMLQELFSPLIKDPGFFTLSNNEHRWRNNNSFENKSLSETLINLGIPKKDIHSSFPTVYHLREFLVKTKEKQDMKLVYLAIHNLVKQRGHFLLGNISWEERSQTGFTDLLVEFFDKIFEINELPNVLKNDDYKKIEKIIKDRNQTLNDRSKEITKIVPKECKEVGKLLVGLNSKFHNLFLNSENFEELKSENKGIKLSDDPENFDFSLLQEKQIELIELAQEIFLGITLDELLGDSNFVAESKVKEYKLNKKQLKLLKKYIFDMFGQQKYNDFFVTKREVMSEYLNKPSAENLGRLSYFDQYRLNKDKGKSKFEKELKNVMSQEVTDSELLDVKGKIERYREQNEFLPFINNISNASIPYQNSVYEAKKILLNQQFHHPELTDDLIENVITLISFRIPYYIGPLAKAEKQSNFSWNERKRDANVTPFNFDDVIDRATSAQEFIRRMTNKCTYLIDEDVLPKHSLLYQEMEVLNELNGINLRSEIDTPGKEHRIPIDLRDKLIEYHFKFSRKVTHKSFKEAIKKHESVYNNKQIYGTQKEDKFASSMTSYNDFREILGKEKLDSNLEAIELIILWVTIFNEKSIIREKINDNFDFITETELEKILKLDYTGWGRISGEALILDSNGESILDLMRNDGKVFMEALTSSDHDFQEIFKSRNQRNHSGHKIKYSDVKELKSSPALRKSIWSSIKIIEELVRLFDEPENIIIEFAREEQEKKRTTEWSEYWNKLVSDKKLQKEEDFTDMFVSINEYGKDNLNHKLEKLKLYLLQGGKCLYTLEKINLKSLLSQNNSDYHIDHILPRNFVKDDSINNKALVTRRANSLKSGDKMPLKLVKDSGKAREIIQYWERLVELEMMTSSKYYKLMKETFDDQDKERFIARQLVETRQISVHLKTLLDERFNSKKKIVNIQPLKAGVVTEVRKKLDIPKIRNLNDHHHAVDALLVATSYMFGEFIKPGMFTFDLRKHKAIEKWRSTDIDNTSTKSFKPELFLVSEMKKRVINKNQTFEQLIIEDIETKSPLVTKKPGNSEGAFYKQTIYSPKEKEPKYVSDKTKKFVHIEIKTAFSLFIEYLVRSKKGEISKKLSIVDVTNFEKANNDVRSEDFIVNKVKQTEKRGEVVKARVLREIQKGDKIIFDNNPFYYISSGELGNAKQLEIPMELQKSLIVLMNTKRANEYTKDRAIQVYNEVVEDVIVQYSHLLPSTPSKRDSSINRIRVYFEQTEMNQVDFINSVNEVLKLTSPSATRSEKLGGRFIVSSKRIIENGKYTSNSITGLIHKRPKQFIKYTEQ